MKENDKVKNYTAIRIVSIIILGLVLIYWLKSGQKIDEENLKIGFAGVIERVDYDIKQFPTIEIGNSRYYIGAGYDTDHQIEIGDSVIKKSGSSIYKLIKRKSHKIIEFRR